MRVARMGLSGAILCTFVIASVGCQNKLYEENRQLHAQSQEQQAKLSQMESDRAQVAAMQQQLAERDAKINELQNQLRQPTAGAANGNLEGIEASYDDASGKMTVAVPGDVLFASGDATVRDTAKATLDKVAASLKRDYAGKPVRIEGHTDNDPIKYSKWQSNQELSEARAAAVKGYLVKKGVEPSLITVAGLGAQQPKGKNKEANRRVDIVVAMR